MRQIVRNCWAVVAGVALLALVGGCGPSLECQTEEDCGDGFDCFDNSCISVSSECFLDRDCGLGLCVESVCVDRACEGPADCPSGGTCSAGICIERQCELDSQCFTGLVCDEGLCRTQPRQCTAPGQTCDPDSATRDGFSCEDTGFGHQCYRTCNSYRVCLASGQSSTRLDCGTGSVCVTSGVTNPICQPSECSGYYNAAEDCAALVANEPGRFSIGVHCARSGGINRCEPAGTRAAGEQCNNIRQCGEGLVCVTEAGGTALGTEGFCAEACSSDAACSGGDACIGAATGALHGVGFCGDKCDAQSFDPQCDATTACEPITQTDGLCIRSTTRSSELYGQCDPTRTTDCPDNSACVGLDDGFAQCLPLCDDSLPSQAARNASCPGATTTGFFQIAHMGIDRPDVDIFVDGEFALTLATDAVAGDADGLIELEAGARQIVIRAAGLPCAVVDSTCPNLFETTINVARRQAVILAALPNNLQSDGLRVVASPLPRGIEAGAEETTLRFVHGVAGVGTVDVVVVTAGGEITNTADRLGLIEGLELNQTSDFVTLGSETVDVHLIPSGGDGSTILFSATGYALEDGAVQTIYVAGDLRASGVGTVGPEVRVIDYVAPPRGQALGGYCVGLNNRNGYGGCVELCTAGDDFGSESCSAPVSACEDLAPGIAWCLPSDTKDLGESCDDDAECRDGTYCSEGPFGDSGTCRAYCQPGTQSNPNLGCEAGEACIPKSGYTNLGECRIPCNPSADFTDSNCPAGMRTCLGSPGAAYCAPSGSLSAGAECGDPREQNCAAGLVCAQSGQTLTQVLIQPFDAPLGGQVATCREICTPFTSNSGCSDGFACSPITPQGESRSLGHCVPAVETPIPSLADCAPEELGMMCDENSYCIEASSNACVPTRGQCLQLCDFATGGGCSAGANCIEGFVGGPLLGIFGLCQ